MLAALQVALGSSSSPDTCSPLPCCAISVIPTRVWVIGIWEWSDPGFLLCCFFFSLFFLWCVATSLIFSSNLVSWIFTPKNVRSKFFQPLPFLCGFCSPVCVSSSSLSLPFLLWGSLQSMRWDPRRGGAVLHLFGEWPKAPSMFTLPICRLTLQAFSFHGRFAVAFMKNTVKQWMQCNHSRKNYWPVQGVYAWVGAQAGPCRWAQLREVAEPQTSGGWEGSQCKYHYVLVLLHVPTGSGYCLL